MSRIFINAIFLLISFNAIGQTCPTLISPMNGSKLPSSDYWYKAITETGTTFMGHFALKR